MATYSTQTVIEPEDLVTSAEPDAVIERAEAAVRTTLAGTSTEGSGEVMLGWLARSVQGTVPWDPRTEAVPDGANYLICRGRLTV